MSSEDAATEAACGALAVLTHGNTDLSRSIDVAEIDSGKCIRCLTCYRLCPYASVEKGKRIEIIPDACAGCGICFAECPRKAIGMGHTDSEIDKQARIGSFPKNREIDPVIVAFCCNRSAARAHDQAIALNYRLPAHLKLVRVPCAGSVSTSHVLEAFTHGAFGVMILTCHEGNCHSETGNRHARRRVDYLSGHFNSIGLDGNRLIVKTLAANMETEFVQIAQDFAQALQETKSI
jgi:coenzyme F420-reducing hydrogenase delta subunit/Pyruvate/2-oxoacid:ferredoxin oxidoreductase delta subunit